MKSYALLSLAALAATTGSRAALPSVGPDYARPAVPAQTAYASAGDLGSWKTATPSDALERGNWWALFGDRELDELETRALGANQDLRAAAARVQQARAAAGLARSAYWPQVAVNGSVVRQQTSKTIDNPFPNSLSTTYTAPLIASWEIDLFGRIRRLSESARADAAASSATFEAVRLALTAEVASTYFSLRATDEELGLVRNTIGLRRSALDLPDSGAALPDLLEHL